MKKLSTNKHTTGRATFLSMDGERDIVQVVKVFGLHRLAIATADQKYTIKDIRKFFGVYLQMARH